MRQLQPLLWTKGTLLTPQHLQVQDRFAEDVLHFRLESLAFKPWGFLSYAFDRERFDTGTLAVSSASGILPDGLLFDIPSADSAPPDRPLTEIVPPDTSTVGIHLGVPAAKRDGTNVAIANGSMQARFHAGIRMVRDEASGAEKPVQVAEKAFRFLTDDEARQGYSTLRIGRIQRTASGGFELDEEFVPPLLDIAASGHLMTIARALVESLAARSTELAGARRHKNEALADFTSSEIAAFWMLFAINSHYPGLRHLAEVRRGHPEALFREMLSLAGALTAFSRDIHPRDLPVYQHDDISGCFRALAAKLRLLLETVVPKNSVAIRLNKVEPTIFTAALADERLLSNTRFYLAVRADINEGELIAGVPKSLRVGSVTNIQQLVQHAMPGVQLTHVPRPPASLPVRLDHAYFSLTQSGDIWTSILRARNVGVYVPAEFPGAELELLILLPAGR